MGGNMSKDTSGEAMVFQIGLAVGVVVILGVLSVMSIINNYAESKIEEEVTTSYYSKLKDTCEGYEYGECQVVKVKKQKLLLEPLRLTFSVTEDFDSLVYTEVTLDKLEKAPSDDMNNKFIKLLFKEGYAYSVEIVGSKEDLRESVKKAINDR